MNTMLTNETRHEPSIRPEQPLAPVRRVGLVDRAALYVGVALIKWGRRPSSAPQHERRANLLERALLSNERAKLVDANRQKALLQHAQTLRML